MTPHILVAPYNEKLMGQLRQWKMVILASGESQVGSANNHLNRDNRLHAVVLRTGKALSAIEYEELWENIPLFIYADEFGTFRDLSSKVESLRKLGARFFLSGEKAENYQWVQMLASMGFNCGVHFGKNAHWDAASDLLHYSFYSPAKHGQVEPFNYISGNFSVDSSINYAAVYFDDPSRYLHINENLEIAASSQELNDGIFLAKGIEELKTISSNKAYETRLNAWRGLFLRNSECSGCESWRVCLGKHEGLSDKNGSKMECQAFYLQILEAIMQKPLPVEGKPEWRF